MSDDYSEARFSHEQTDRILQEKLNALMAIYLHERRISKLRKKNTLIVFLSIAVPTFYLVPRLLAKGTTFAFSVEIIGEFLAALLLVLAILQVVYKWQDNEARHLIMLNRNRDILHEANDLLVRKSMDSMVIDQFLKRVKYVDSDDEDLLLDSTKQENQAAYRNALKVFIPNQTSVCRRCGADPLNFTKGPCEMCGGTPTKRI
jgi:mobilome CxxCx(11)CxxC protein